MLMSMLFRKLGELCHSGAGLRAHCDWPQVEPPAAIRKTLTDRPTHVHGADWNNARQESTRNMPDKQNNQAKYDHSQSLCAAN